MILKMRNMTESGVLSGAVNGKAAFAAFIAETSDEPNEPNVLFLDFADIEVATASFLRESAMALKTYKRAIGSKQYPVLANINDSIADEISVVTEARNDAIIVCDLDGQDQVSNIRMIGALDPKQAITFEFVERLNGADAGSLMERFGEAEKTTSTTAWNNRLAGLMQRGLLREFTNGRSKFYRPLLEEAK